MFVAWQPLNNSEPEDKEHRLEIPICISGIGLLQLFAVPYVETLTEKVRRTSNGHLLYRCHILSFDR